MYGYSREAVRVKVKKCEMNCPPEWRKFSVDPQITSVEILHSILAKAFDIRSDFLIFYRTFDPLGHETFLAVISDWDLDAAFLRTHNYSVQTGSEPCLNLRVDVKSFSEINNFEKNSSETYKLEHSPLQQSIDAGQKYVQNMQNKLPGLIMNQMEKTLSMVQRALNFAEEQIPIYPPRTPLSDSEFRGFLDSVGQIIRPQELRHVVFLGGIDPSLRRVVWKHILNVYPNGMTGRERMDYMKLKAAEYYKLRDVWKSAVQSGSLDSELSYVTSMVKKDVLRTDRLHQFYAGSDDNQNIASLFNILTTFALYHPKVSYCQGMSDLASPLLVTMNDEAHAYICFCAIMERLQANFMLDGIAMTQKFSHLTEALQYYDSEFYEYLKLQQADDLLFCYRWLLLELKREFPFEDSLRMLEVQWSSLRCDPPDKELKLFDKEYVPQSEVKPTAQNPLVLTDVQRKHRENHYANICALRRQTSSSSLYLNFSSNQTSLHYLSGDINCTKLDNFKRLNHSLDENITRIPLRNTNLMKAHQSLDESKMLLLIKNISPCENYPDSFNNLDDLNVQKLSSEIKTKNNLCDNKNSESKKIIFHSTNPFINDAKGGSTEILICDERVGQKNFENIQSNLENRLTNRNGNFSNLLSDSSKRNMRESSTKPESIISTQIINKHKGHFKDLKERITASKKGILASIDKIETQLEFPVSQNSSDGEIYQQFPNKNSTKKNQKVVKNLNEFLNFSNKSKISDKLAQNTTKLLKANTFDQSYENYKCILVRNECVDILSNSRPVIKLTNNFDDQYTFENDDIKTKLQNLKNDDNVSLKDRNKDASENIPNVQNKLVIHEEKVHELVGSPRKVFQSENSNYLIEDLENKSKNINDITISYKRFDKHSSDENFFKQETIPFTNTKTFPICRDADKKEVTMEDQNKLAIVSNINADVYIWENPLHQISRNSTSSLNDIEVNENGSGRSSSTGLEISLQKNVFIDNKYQDTSDKQHLKYDEGMNLEQIDEAQYQNPGSNSQRNFQNESKLISNKIDSNCDMIERNRIESPSLNPFLSDCQPNEMKTKLREQKEYGKFEINVNISENAEFIDKVENEIEKVKVSNSESFMAMDSYTAIASDANKEDSLNKFAMNVNYKTTTFLPPPNEFGGGNPFLIFLCLTLLLQHRNVIMRNNLDYNEMAMHFDKMVRKHDVNRVLNQARRMYFEYLKTHNALANAAVVTDNLKANYTERS